MEQENEKMAKILDTIYSFCEECPSHEDCPEWECSLFQIEQIVLEEDNEDRE